MSFTDLQIPHHSQNIIFQTENRKVDLYRFAKAIANLAIRLQKTGILANNHIHIVELLFNGTEEGHSSQDPL